MITRMKREMHRWGLLPTYHQARNRWNLTVVMFHRVLAPVDPRWREADPTWTMSDTLFGECLQFFYEHYLVVGLDDVLQSARTGGPLPERSLLITIDDGWADTAEYATRQLEQAGLPAAVFVIAGAVGRRPGMLSLEQLRALPAAGIRIGSHGLTHEPIPAATDVRQELCASRELLGEMLGEPPATLSFPHGAYDDPTVALARQAGYRLLFTSDPYLNCVRPGEPWSRAVARISLPAGEISDKDGRLRPELLALWLFTRSAIQLRET